MLALSVSSLPEGSQWEYELKRDGYRALAIKTGRQVQLRFRNDKDFGGRFPGVIAALAALTNEMVMDGEVVALDESCRTLFQYPPELCCRSSHLLIRFRPPDPQWPRSPFEVVNRAPGTAPFRG